MIMTMMMNINFDNNNDNSKNVLKKLTIDNKFCPDNFWKLCKKSRKPVANTTSIETSDGNELFGEDLMLNAYRQEFTHRLRQREIVPELKNYEKRTELLCNMYLERAKKLKEPAYTEEEYLKV